MTKHLAILSGKGGTGKTTLAINLAAALQSIGEEVILIDGNLESPHIGFALGHGPHIDTLHDVLTNRLAPHHALQEHPTGFRYIVGDPHPKGLQPDKQAFDKFKRAAASVVLYDGPPTSHEALLAATDQVLIVTNAELPALVDANRLLAQAEHEQKIVAGVVINKHNKNGLSIQDVERFLNVPVIATIPYDERFQDALRRQVPYHEMHGNRPAAKAIKELAARLVSKPHI